ncbi:MAG: hypothetical protein NT033_00630 [Candidatus Omnitrophica bacterium]|nr:hypothetical protein [Candidatus Omnitrophota bacterium]
MSKDELKDAVSALKTRLEKSDLEDKRPTAANLGRIGNGIITAGRLNQTKLIFLMTWEEAGMV